MPKVLTRLTKKPSKFIAAMLIGSNISLVVYGLFMGDVLMGLFVDRGTLSYSTFWDFSLLAQTIISALVILLTAEFLPRILFQIYSNTLLKWLALPAYVFYLLFSLISEFVIGVSDFILKVLFKINGNEVQLILNKIELRD